MMCLYLYGSNCHGALKNLLSLQYVSEHLFKLLSHKLGSA